eukprot:2606627-Rhodomonas_salina.1
MRVSMWKLTVLTHSAISAADGATSFSFSCCTCSDRSQYKRSVSGTALPDRSRYQGSMPGTTPQYNAACELVLQHLTTMCGKVGWVIA